MAILPPNIRVANNTKYILCAIRKKWLVLTPEEKVRQFILQRLINEQGYPQKYISVEKTLKIEIDDEAFDRLYGHISHPIEVKKKGQKIAVRIISQFGEECTRVLTAN